MAIAYVGGIRVSAGGVTSLTLTRSVTAGNRLFAGCATYEYQGSADGRPNTVGDSVDTYALDCASPQRAAFAGQNQAALYSTPSASTSGTRNLVCTYEIDSWVNAVFFEFSGIATSSGLDKTATNVDGGFGSTTPTSGTTAATAQADEVVIALLAVPSSSNGLGIAVPTGFTNIGVDQNGYDTIGISCDYKIVSSTGTQSAAWGTINSAEPWTALVATYKAAATTPTISLGVSTKAAATSNSSLQTPTGINTQAAGSTFFGATFTAAVSSTWNFVDNKTNSYTPITMPGGGSFIAGNAGSTYLRAWYKQNGLGGTGHRWTGSSNQAIGPTVFACEILGAKTSGGPHAVGGGQDNASPYTASVSVTSNCLLVAIFCGSAESAATHAEANGFTIIQDVTDGTANWTGCMAVKVVTPGTHTVSFTETAGASNGTPVAVLLVAFEEGTPGSTTQMSFTINVGGTVTVIKKIGKASTVSATGTPTLAKKISKILSATATGASTLTKKISRTLSTAATGSASVIKKISKAFAAASTATVSYTKSSVIGMAFSVAAHGTASIASQAILGVTSTVTAVGSTTLGKKISKSFTASAVGAATLSKKIKLTLAIAAIGAVNRVSKISKAAAVAAHATVSFAEAFVTGIARSFSAHGTVSSVQTFIQGTGEIIFTVTRLITRAVTRNTLRAINRLRQL